MEKFTVIENIYSSTAWNSILEIALQIADRFQIIYPNGEFDEENPLLAGKPDFLKLGGLAAEPWEGMSDATRYSGILTSSAKQIIRKYLFQTPDKLTYSLWHFSIFKGDQELLNVQDFNVALITSDAELTEHLARNGVDWREL